MNREDVTHTLTHTHTHTHTHHTQSLTQAPHTQHTESLTQAPHTHTHTHTHCSFPASTLPAALRGRTASQTHLTPQIYPFPSFLLLLSSSLLLHPLSSPLLESPFSPSLLPSPLLSS